MTNHTHQSALDGGTATRTKSRCESRQCDSAGQERPFRLRDRGHDQRAIYIKWREPNG
jgi:hypothetical protein